MRWTLTLLACGIILTEVSPTRAEESAGPLYEENFDALETGTTPDGYMVLLGEFVVTEGEGGKFLEIAGTPLEDYGFLFGPSKLDGLEVTAKIRSESKGRIHPGFGVGLNGVSGYKLIVSPSRRQVELSRGTVTVATSEYKWKSGTWTQLRLQSRKTGETEWTIRAKAWQADGEEPADWTLVHADSKKPPSGRPTVWGTPYSGKPIQFDDLKVIVAPE